MSDEHVVHIFISGPADNLGRTPFTAFWRGTGALKTRAQCFRMNLEDFHSWGPVIIHETEEAAKAAAWKEND